LSLGGSDDEGDEDIDEEPQVIREGIAIYASLAGTSDVSGTLVAPRTDDGSHLKKKRSKNKRKRTKKPSKWADKCMYAELLEMKEEPNLWGDHSNDAGDGLPSDLERSWVAVAPVPTGKRCLAITHQSTSGIIGISPNTTLRSRLLGKMLLPRFPSSLPPLTVLDCILDGNWRTNGILHVLDVLKWKGQDIADCETPFRFWWRDTRLAELPKFAPPSAVFSFTGSTADQQSASQPSSYNFQYPTSFIPIPYHTDTTLPMLHSCIVPLARSTREIFVDIPTSTSSFQFLPSSDSAMSIDTGADHSGLTTVPVHVTSDGLLLYVSHASYEEGISPLSCWIPIRPVIIPGEQEIDDTERESNGPLDLFQRLVQRRLTRVQQNSKLHSDGMIM
jgi:snurportin-1